MTDPDSFCDFFTGGRSKSGDAGCSVDAGISVNDQGQISTPGSEGYRGANKEETQAALDKDLLGYMQKQFASDWEREMWEVRYIAGDSLFAIFRTSAPFQGLTWLPEGPGNVTGSGQLRADKEGNPQFGARRNRDNNTYGLHFGTDYATSPGDSIRSAFDGTVTYHENAHKKFGMVLVTTASGHSQQTLYTNKIIGKDYTGKWQVRRGEVIATAANLHTGTKDGYPDSVPNHVHNAYLSPEGIYIGPRNNFAITKGTKEIANSCGTSPCISFHNDDKPQITGPRKTRP